LFRQYNMWGTHFVKIHKDDLTISWKSLCRHVCMVHMVLPVNPKACGGGGRCVSGWNNRLRGGWVLGELGFKKKKIHQVICHRYFQNIFDKVIFCYFWQSEIWHFESLSVILDWHFYQSSDLSKKYLEYKLFANSRK